MPMTDAGRLKFQQLFFENDDFENVGDAAGVLGSATAGSYYISLHTAVPGDAGDQSTNEVAYTGYNRVAVARSTAGWTAATVGSTGNVLNDGAISFGARSGGGTPTATAFGIGSDPTPTNPGTLEFFGNLTASFLIDGTKNPTFQANALSGNIT